MNYLRFIDDSHPLEDLVVGSYEPFLVVLSVFIAVLASYVALCFSNSYLGKKTDKSRYLWLASGGIAQGLGIWAMHFVAMLAMSMPIIINYDPVITFLSIIPAIIASMVILSVGHQAVSLTSMWLRSLLMGGGIGLMHYTGMSAMIMDAEVYYDLSLFLLSLTVAVLLSFASLSIKLRANMGTEREDCSEPHIIGAALFMGLAISAMHYTAMLAIEMVPVEHSSVDAHVFAPGSLALLVSGVMVVIISLMIISLRVGQRLELVSLLEESEEKFRSIIDNSGDGIITIDGNGVIESFNMAAEKIFGYQADEVIGETVSILLPENERIAHSGYVADSELYEPRVINSNRVLQGCKKSGELIPVELNVTPMKLRGRRSFIGVIRDVSERVKAELQLSQARDEAESANNAKSEFLARMSHELRTPLNAILGFGQLLQMDEESQNKAHSEKIEHIMIAGKHLLNLVNEVLDIAKIDANEMEFMMDDVVMEEVVENSLLLIKPLADAGRITINGSWQGPCCVRADALRLKQVLINLLSNAVKYNREGGSVSIAVDHVAPDSIRVSITDTGVGIEPQFQAEIFEPFKQIDNLDGHPVEGTGIGLSITRKIIEAMGGKIGVMGEYGKGSTFWFELPCAR